MEENSKDILTKTALLNYYNQVLYDNGLISEDERNRMSRLINEHS